MWNQIPSTLSGLSCNKGAGGSTLPHATPALSETSETAKSRAKTRCRGCSGNANTSSNYERSRGGEEGRGAAAT